MNSVYLDHAATTPILADALSAFTAQASKLGNPSSLHTQGRAARKDLEDARESLAKAAGCLSSEIIFTASGTEANNIALKGAVLDGPQEWPQCCSYFSN
jgi:cysteine desulfurase